MLSLWEQENTKGKTGYLKSAKVTYA